MCPMDVCVYQGHMCVGGHLCVSGHTSVPGMKVCWQYPEIAPASADRMSSKPRFSMWRWQSNRGGGYFRIMPVCLWDVLTSWGCSMYVLGKYIPGTCVRPG